MQWPDDLTHPLLQVLESVAPAGEDMETEQPQQGSKLDRHQLLYCERFVEWLTDLLSQLPTRRFVHSLLEDKAVLVKCKMSALYSHPQGEPAAHVCCSAHTSGAVPTRLRGQEFRRGFAPRPEPAAQKLAWSSPGWRLHSHP